MATFRIEFSTPQTRGTEVTFIEARDEERAKRGLHQAHPDVRIFAVEELRTPKAHGSQRGTRARINGRGR